jgi:hypothetical protein
MRQSSQRRKPRTQGNYSTASMPQAPTYVCMYIHHGRSRGCSPPPRVVGLKNHLAGSIFEGSIRSISADHVVKRANSRAEGMFRQTTCKLPQVCQLQWHGKGTRAKIPGHRLAAAARWSGSKALQQGLVARQHFGWPSNLFRKGSLLGAPVSGSSTRRIWALGPERGSISTQP